MKTNTCRDCDHCNPFGTDGGECYRNPPGTDGEGPNTYDSGPTVRLTRRACGEFKAKRK